MVLARLTHSWKTRNLSHDRRKIFLVKRERHAFGELLPKKRVRRSTEWGRMGREESLRFLNGERRLRARVQLAPHDP